MTQLMLVTQDKPRFADFAAGIESAGGSLRWEDAGEQALALLAEESVDLVVADEKIGDMTGLSFVERLVKVNPMVNSAVVSSLSERQFHAAGEGLGILMALPSEPDASDAERLMARLHGILGQPQRE